MAQYGRRLKKKLTTPRLRWECFPWYLTLVFIIITDSPHVKTSCNQAMELVTCSMAYGPLQSKESVYLNAWLTPPCILMSSLVSLGIQTPWLTQAAMQVWRLLHGHYWFISHVQRSSWHEGKAKWCPTLRHNYKINDRLKVWNVVNHVFFPF